MNLITNIINFMKGLFCFGKRGNKKKEVKSNIKKARKNDPFIYD
jgi:hypothetical protein